MNLKRRRTDKSWNLIPWMVLAAAMYLLALPGCQFCQQAANKSTLRCRVLNEVEKCGPEAAAILIQCIPFIISEDWSALFAMLEQQYPAEAQCIEQNVQAQLPPPKQLDFKAKLAAYKAAHRK